MSRRYEYVPIGFKVTLPKKAKMKKKQLLKRIEALETVTADLLKRLDFQVSVVEQLMAANDRHDGNISRLQWDTRSLRPATGREVRAPEHWDNPAIQIARDTQINTDPI